jgi:hypothetical protein
MEKTRKDGPSRLADWVVYHSEIADAETAECVWSTCRSMFSRIPEEEIESVLAGLASSSGVREAVLRRSRLRLRVIEGGRS